MTKPDVKTVATARRRSLIKWNRIKNFSRDLFNEIETSCGFCELGTYLSKKDEIHGRCHSCGVKTRCEAILEVTKKMEITLEKMINETIQFLEDMDVKEK